MEGECHYKDLKSKCLFGLGMIFENDMKLDVYCFILCCIKAIKALHGSVKVLPPDHLRGE